MVKKKQKVKGTMIKQCRFVEEVLENIKRGYFNITPELLNDLEGIEKDKFVLIDREVGGKNNVVSVKEVTQELIEKMLGIEPKQPAEDKGYYEHPKELGKLCCGSCDFETYAEGDMVRHLDKCIKPKQEKECSTCYYYNKPAAERHCSYCGTRDDKYSEWRPQHHKKPIDEPTDGEGQWLCFFKGCTYSTPYMRKLLDHIAESHYDFELPKPQQEDEKVDDKLKAKLMKLYDLMDEWNSHPERVDRIHQDIIKLLRQYQERFCVEWIDKRIDFLKCRIAQGIAWKFEEQKFRWEGQIYILEEIKEKLRR